MIVTCPNCISKFNLPDELYTIGRKARCSQCRHVFALPDLSTQVTPTDDFGAADASNSSAGYTESNFDLPEMPDAKKKGKGIKIALPIRLKGRKKIELIIAGVIAAILLIVIAAGILMLVKSFSGKKAEPISNMENSTAEVANLSPSGADLSQLEVIVANHLIVQNSKIGQIYVIRTKVRNNSDTPKSLIMVEAVLYAANNSKILSQKSYCGTDITQFQLQILDKDSMFSAVNNQLEIITSNNGIKPGKEIQCLIVIPELPANFSTFEVHVVDAKEGTLEQAKNN